MNKTDGAITSIGLTAPIWMMYLEEVNAVVATLVGLATLATICVKLYYMIKDHNKEQLIWKRRTPNRD